MSAETKSKSAEIKKSSAEINREPTPPPPLSLPPPPSPQCSSSSFSGQPRRSGNPALSRLQARKQMVTSSHGLSTHHSKDDSSTKTQPFLPTDNFLLTTKRSSLCQLLRSIHQRKSHSNLHSAKIKAAVLAKSKMHHHQHHHHHQQQQQQQHHTGRQQDCFSDASSGIIEHPTKQCAHHRKQSHAGVHEDPTVAPKRAEHGHFPQCCLPNQQLNPANETEKKGSERSPRMCPVHHRFPSEGMCSVHRRHPSKGIVFTPKTSSERLRELAMTQTPLAYAASSGENNPTLSVASYSDKKLSPEQTVPTTSAKSTPEIVTPIRCLGNPKALVPADLPIPGRRDSFIQQSPKAKRDNFPSRRAHTAPVYRKPQTLSAESGGQNSKESSDNPQTYCTCGSSEPPQRSSSVDQKGSQPFCVTHSSSPASEAHGHVITHRCTNYLKPKPGVITHRADFNAPTKKPTAVHRVKAKRHCHRIFKPEEPQHLKVDQILATSESNPQQYPSQAATDLKEVFMDSVLTENNQDSSPRGNQAAIPSQGEANADSTPVDLFLDEEQFCACGSSQEHMSRPSDSELLQNPSSERLEQVSTDNATTLDTPQLPCLCHQLHSDHATHTIQVTCRSHKLQSHRFLEKSDSGGPELQHFPEDIKPHQIPCEQQISTSPTPARETTLYDLSPAAARETTLIPLVTDGAPTSFAIDHFKATLQRWAKELLHFHAALESSSSTGRAHQSCLWCPKERHNLARQDRQAMQLSQDLRRMIEQFQEAQIKIGENCPTEISRKFANSTEKGLDDQESSRPQLCSHCHIAIQISVHILMEDVHLLLDMLNVKNHYSHGVESAVNDSASKMNQADDNTENVNSCQELRSSEHTAQPSELWVNIGSKAQSDVLSMFSQSQLPPVDRQSLIDAVFYDSTQSLVDSCIDARHAKRKVCSETANILKSQPLLENLNQKQGTQSYDLFCDSGAPFSDNCNSSYCKIHSKACGIFHQNSLSLPLEYESKSNRSCHVELVGKEQEHLCNSLAHSSASLTKVGLVQDNAVENTDDDLGMNNKQQQGTMTRSVHEADQSISQSNEAEPESKYQPKPVESVPCTSDKKCSEKNSPQPSLSSDELLQGSARKKRLGIFLLRYLQHVNGKFASNKTQEQEHMDKSVYHKDPSTFLPKAKLVGNYSKSPDKPHQLNSENSTQNQASPEVNRSLETINNSKQESVASTSFPNNPETINGSKQESVASTSFPNNPETINGSKQESVVSTSFPNNPETINGSTQESVVSTSFPNNPETINGSKQESAVSAAFPNSPDTINCSEQESVVSTAFPHNPDTINGSKQESVASTSSPGTDLLSINSVKNVIDNNRSCDFKSRIPKPIRTDPDVDQVQHLKQKDHCRPQSETAEEKKRVPKGKGNGQKAPFKLAHYCTLDGMRKMRSMPATTTNSEEEHTKIAPKSSFHKHCFAANKTSATLAVQKPLPPNLPQTTTDPVKPFSSISYNMSSKSTSEDSPLHRNDVDDGSHEVQIPTDEWPGASRDLTSCDLTSSPPHVSTVRCTSSCTVSVQGSEGEEKEGDGEREKEGVGSPNGEEEKEVLEAFSTIEQTVRRLALLSGKSPNHPEVI